MKLHNKNALRKKAQTWPCAVHNSCVCKINKEISLKS